MQESMESAVTEIATEATKVIGERLAKALANEPCPTRRAMLQLAVRERMSAALTVLLTRPVLAETMAA